MQNSHTPDPAPAPTTIAFPRAGYLRSISYSGASYVVRAMADAILANRIPLKFSCDGSASVVPRNPEGLGVLDSSPDCTNITLSFVLKCNVLTKDIRDMVESLARDYECTATLQSFESRYLGNQQGWRATFTFLAR